MSTSAPQSPRGARAADKQKRRANSCLPCRESKSRCTGGIPGETENALPEEDEDSSSQQDASMDDEDDGHDASDDSSLAGPHEAFFGTFSLARIVAEVKQLSPSTGRAREIIDLIDTVKAFSVNGSGIGAESTENAQGSLAGDHTPLVSSTSDPQLPKALRRLHSRYLSVKKLLDSGMAMQAWTTFASLVRDAEIMGREFDDPHLPEHLLTVVVDRPDVPEKLSDKGNALADARRRMWWLLAVLDIRLSFILGRAPSLSHLAPGLSQSFDTDRDAQVSKSQRAFTRHKAELLSWIYRDKVIPEALSDTQKTKLEGFLEELDAVQRDLPPLSHSGPTEVSQTVVIAKHHLEVHLFAMVSNGFMARCITAEQAQLGPSRQRHAASQVKSSKARAARRQTPSKYYKEMLQSGRRVMELFHFIHTSEPSRSGPSWTRCFGAYSAASIFGIARLRQEVELEADSSRIETTLEVFRDIASSSPDLGIGQFGASSLEQMLDGLRSFEKHLKDAGPTHDMPAPHLPQSSRADTSPSRVKHELAPYTTKFRKHPKKRPNSSMIDEEAAAPEKRARYGEGKPAFDTPAQGEAPAWGMNQEASFGQQMSSFGDVPNHSFDATASVSFEHPAFPTSAATSFASNMDALEYTSLRYNPPQDVPDIPWPTNRRHHPEVPWPTPALIYPPLYHNGWENHFNTLEPQEVIAEHFFRNPDPPPQVVYKLLSDEQPHPDHGYGGFYPGVGEPYPAADQVRSSPLVGEMAAQPPGPGFPQADLASRRQSVAEVEVKGNWALETPVHYVELGKDTTGAARPTARTPPREMIVSPVNEGGLSQTHGSSLTPNQVPQQRRSGHGEYSTMATQLQAGAPGMRATLGPSQEIRSQESAGSRRASLAPGGELGAGEMHLASMPEGRWVGQMGSNGGNPYDGASLGPQYRLDMESRNHPVGVAYSQTGPTRHQYQTAAGGGAPPAQHLRPHHHHFREYQVQAPPAPGQSVTTAPFSGSNQGWWSH
ncbi:hypothetical protein B0A52_06630 [Exophiala mesophila]|uniref:Xylanolytic transcriptional activator regulatory domain-containing protein n=1 Tax=Exophiala mesophila TaxID=212818 RepID=A0A438N1K8_EXOME|nr:hypothetical protein B0A52_06630 [Exophiala mesophila]